MAGRHFYFAATRGRRRSAHRGRSGGASANLSRSAPNLPIVTRPDDLACVLPQRNGLPGVLVPHATITALQSHPFPDRPLWSGEVAALDLWLPLMAGGTVTVASAAPQTAAA